MNSSPASVVAILDRLSIGVARVSIRHGTTAAKPTRYRKKNYAWTGFKHGHGEKIYVYNHVNYGMIVYSHDPELPRDSHHALSQIPFTVKKQKPAELRKDYWRPMCMIEFGPGRGVVGRSVFRQLREFRQRHELEWGWQAKEFQQLDRWERGVRILNQKPNAVADIAAVLSGVGRGNLMWTTAEPLSVEEGVAEVEAEKVAQTEEATEDAKTEESVESNPASVEATAETKATPTAHEDIAAKQAGETKAIISAETDSGKATAKKSKSKKVTASPPSPPKKLLNATIYWATDVDLHWARKWSDNVVHKFGLPDKVKVRNWQTKTLTQEADEVDEGEAVEEDEDRTVGGEEGREAESAEKKKGWLGWLGGKPGGSSQDART